MYAAAWHYSQIPQRAAPSGHIRGMQAKRKLPGKFTDLGGFEPVPKGLLKRLTDATVSRILQMLPHSGGHLSLSLPLLGLGRVEMKRKQKIDWKAAEKEVNEAICQADKIAMDWPEKWWISIEEENFPPRIAVSFCLINFDGRRSVSYRVSSLKYPDRPTMWARDLRDEELIELGDLIVSLAEGLGFRAFHPYKNKGEVTYQLRPHYKEIK